MAYTVKIGGGGSYTAQTSHNSIAGVWVMQMGRGHKGMIDSCTHANQGMNIFRGQDVDGAQGRGYTYIGRRAGFVSVVL